MAVISFIDNDIILKLTSCDLFWEAMDLLGVQIADIRVLTSTRFVFRRNQSIKEQYSEEVRNKAIELVKKFSTVEADQSNPFFSLQVEGINIGELTLIYEAIAVPSFYFITGDKNCLRALVKTPELTTTREKLNGRVICLEQLIYKLIIDTDFEVIRSKVVSARECDTSLKVAFGSGDRAEQPNVIWALEERIKELNQECPNLLIDFCRT